MSAHQQRISLRQKVAEIEELFDAYKSTTGNEIDNIMKVAVLMRLLKPELKRHVQLQMTATTTYTQARDMTTDYDRATATWAVDTVRPTCASSSSGDGLVPMNVDQVRMEYKGKGKGGKGKGKRAKGKDKGGKDKSKGLALSHSSTTMSTKERARASRNVVRAVEMR